MANEINWKQIIVSAIITVIVTVLAGVILFNIQNKDAKLTYSMESSLPFEGDSENLVIFKLIIANKGNKEVEDVYLDITPAAGTIKQTKVKLENQIPYNESLSNNHYIIHFANLNPKETATVSLLINFRYISIFGNDLSISLRGKGVSGVIANDPEGFNFFGRNLKIQDFGYIVPISVMILFSIVLLLINRIGIPFFGYQKNMQFHFDEQNKILAYLCGIHGLEDLAKEYSRLNKGSISYWSESEMLTIEALKDPLNEKTNQIKKVFLDLMTITNISEDSKGIIYYNLSKISKAQKKRKESNEFLQKAKLIIPKLIDKRLKIDPFWQKKDI